MVLVQIIPLLLVRNLVDQVGQAGAHLRHGNSAPAVEVSASIYIWEMVASAENSVHWSECAYY